MGTANFAVSGQIRDLAFLNKDTGFAALNNNDVLLKTTDGGTNWNIVNNFRIWQLCVGDNNTLFGIAVNGSKMYRTFDGGATFDSVGAPGGGYCTFYFVNKDTGWSTGITGIFMTINGGNSFQLVSNQFNCGSIMFFVKQKYNNQYYGFHINNGLHKTTNSGVNWANVTGISTNAINCFFLNKDTGCVTDNPPIGNPRILYTSNGGLNWTIPYSSSISITYLFFSTPLKGWCGTDTSNTILATINVGISWGKQTLPIFNSGHTFFVDSSIGWTSNGFNFNNLAKTTNGGGNISAVETINSTMPSKFRLFQNYPNPFNPSTTIEFDIPQKSFTKLIIYDILGREIVTLVSEVLNLGSYKVNWDVSNYPSGVYFYELIAGDYVATRKMMILK